MALESSEEVPVNTETTVVWLSPSIVRFWIILAEMHTMICAKGKFVIDKSSYQVK